MEQKPHEEAMPVTPAPASTHHNTTPYQSNPFIASITGLMTLLKVNPVPSLLLGVLLALIATGAFFVSIFFLIIPILGVLVVLAIMMLILPFIIGAYHALAVASIRGETRKTEEFISEAFKKIFPVLGATLLIGLIVFFGFIFFIVPGVIFGSWFSLTFFVMFDENLGVMASMKRSKELVSGHVLEIIGAHLAGGLMSGGSLGGGAGLLTPVIGLAPMTARYQQLKALKASNQPKPALHWMNIVITVVYGLFITAVVLIYSLVIALSIANNDGLRNGQFDQNDSFENRLEEQLKDLEKYDSDNGSYDTDYKFDTPTYTN